MKIKSILAYCSIIALSLSCGNDDTPELQQTKDIEILEENEYIQGQAYIYFDEDTAQLIECDIAEGNVMTRYSPRQENTNFEPEKKDFIDGI